jgi:hypothetical protein
MATLAKNGTYSWQARGVLVRDARHVHNGPSEPAHRGSKDRKRWCRGKVGVGHTLVVAVLRRFTLFPSLVRHCSKCGKEFGTYSGNWGKPPEWASAEDLKALERAKQQPDPAFQRR